MSESKTWPEWPIFWRRFTVDERITLAGELGVKVFYLRNIGKQGVKMGPALAVKVECTCGYPKELLRPDIFGEYES